MNFNCRHQCIGFIWRRLSVVVLSLYMMPLNAEVLVKNIENNDKVKHGAIAEQGFFSDLAGSDSSKLASWQLYAEEWEMARTGESILSLPVLNQTINAWSRDKQKIIEIQYPGGEEGEFWVQQLSDWLVSLAIPSSKLSLVPGSGTDDMIKFSLIK